jgi:putative (di)nucleoside polyphosphate hydrolase
MPLVDPTNMPYRPCAGIMLLNADGLIWIGHRCGDFVADEVKSRWQMPQGGIDEGEDPRPAAFRELYEETGIRNAEIIREARDWITYELPPEAVGIALKGKYRGQKQKWFAMRFTGSEDEVNLAVEGGDPEFDRWKWAAKDEVLANIVLFKRPAYEAVFEEFADLLA